MSISIVIMILIPEAIDLLYNLKFEQHSIRRRLGYCGIHYNLPQQVEAEGDNEKQYSEKLEQCRLKSGSCPPAKASDMQEQSNPKVLPDQCHARGGYGGQTRWPQVYHISVLGQSRGTRLF